MAAFSFGAGAYVGPILGIIAGCLTPDIITTALPISPLCMSIGAECSELCCGAVLCCIMKLKKAPDEAAENGMATLLCCSPCGPCGCAPITKDMSGIPETRLWQLGSCNVVCCCPIRIPEDPNAGHS